MGCVSSNLLNQEEDLTSQLGLGHHIVSLTSTTYGLLSLDPAASEPKAKAKAEVEAEAEQKPEVINSWELMSGLDADSFRFSPLPFSTTTVADRFERLCPPKGENRVVIYTTTLRGVRRTFEACNAVRAAFDAFGVVICERDVSMDSGFREELRSLLKGNHMQTQIVLPKVFVKGFYIGGAEEMLKVAEEGLLGDLLHGLPRKKLGAVCDGCGDMRFLPCFNCNGSCKTLVKESAKTLLVKCTRCNENGLVLCPLCTCT